MSEPSPYKAVGIPATARPGNRHRREKEAGPFMRGESMGHSWAPRYNYNHNSQTCKLCGKAMFLAEGEKCKGGK